MSAEAEYAQTHMIILKFQQTRRGKNVRRKTVSSSDANDVLSHTRHLSTNHIDHASHQSILGRTKNTMIKTCNRV